jgi:hypothetical protein
MTTRKALPQLIAEPAIHAAVSTAAIEIKATKSAAGKTVPKLMENPESCKPQPISHGRSAKNSANLLTTTPITDINKVAKIKSSSTGCAGREFMTKAPRCHAQQRASDCFSSYLQCIE